MQAKLEIIYGVIEQDDAGTYIGKLVGFPHIEFHGGTAAEAEDKLRRTALDYKASGVLVLESHFVKLVQIGGSAMGDGSAPTPDTGTQGVRHADNRTEPGGESLAGQAPDDLDARLQPLLDAFRPQDHGGEFPSGEPGSLARYKRFGADGPPYEVGRPLRKLSDGDWLVEVTMVETGEKTACRLSRIAEDPDA
jgi:hypothetical protein